MRIRSLSHSTYQHQYHIVWGTKYRRKFLKEYVRDELLNFLKKFMKKYPTLHLITVNVDNDHIHMQIEISPDLAVSDVVGRIKSKTSAYLKKKFKFIDRMYLGGGIWSVGYFFSTVGLNEEQIKHYILNQGKKDYPESYSFGFE